MKMCDPHWQALRAAIDSRGLTKYVKSAKAAHAEMVASVKGEQVDNPDPLLYAHNAITANALEIGGLGMLMPQEDGTECCPICVLQVPSWIEAAADDALALLRGTLGKPV